MAGGASVSLAVYIRCVAVAEMVTEGAINTLAIMWSLLLCGLGKGGGNCCIGGVVGVALAVM